jgi:uncharacterized protein
MMFRLTQTCLQGHSAIRACPVSPSNRQFRTCGEPHAVLRAGTVLFGPAHVRQGRFRVVASPCAESLHTGSRYLASIRVIMDSLDFREPGTVFPVVGDSRQAIHGGILLGVVLLPVVVPELMQWPLYLLVPLSIYISLVSLFKRLRDSIYWLHVGRINRFVCVLMVCVIVLTTSTMFVYQFVVCPDVHHLSKKLPLTWPAHLGVVLILFSIVNALLEEVVFRGVFLDAFVSQFGVRWAIVVQGIVFGMAHANGYPEGIIGMALAGIYGIILGLLRQLTGGIFASWICHTFADATVFWIVVSWDA